MNITLRKLALVEKSMAKQEEEMRILGYSSCPIDKDLQQRVIDLMNKVRQL